MAELKPTPPPIQVPDSVPSVCLEDVQNVDSPSYDDQNPELRAEAPAFVPQEIKLPPRVKTSKGRGDKKDLYRVFDSVPFTPSQGVKTPSPNNMAALRFHKYSPFATGGYPDSPTTVLRSFGGASDSSATSESVNPAVMASPMHPGAAMGPHPYQSSYMVFPPAILGYSTDGLSGSPHGSPLIGSPCGTPTAMMFPQTPFAVGPHSPFAPYPGPAGFSPQPQQQMYAGPDPMSPGHRPYSYYHPMFSTSFPPFIPGMGSPTGSNCNNNHQSKGGLNFDGPDGACNERSRSPSMFPPRRPASNLSHMAPANHTAAFQNGMPGTFARNNQSPLPRNGFIYDDLSDDSSGNHPNMRSRFRPRRSIQDLKIGPDGQPRLNARQRRTLRRAKERALKGLLDTGHNMIQQHGLSAGADTASDVPDCGYQSAERAGSSNSSQYSDKEVHTLFYNQNSGQSKPAGGDSDLEGVDVAELIKQLSVKKEDGVVDDKLLRDLQIIQSLIGALKVQVPPPQPPPRKSPPRRHADFHMQKPRRTYNVHAYA